MESKWIIILLQCYDCDIKFNLLNKNYLKLQNKKILKLRMNEEIDLYADVDKVHSSDFQEVHQTREPISKLVRITSARTVSIWWIF